MKYFKLIIISLSSRTLVREVSHVHEEAVFLIGKGVGGYLASMMMALDEENLFKCAAIISPVIDWLRYGKRAPDFNVCQSFKKSSSDRGNNI